MAESVAESLFNGSNVDAVYVAEVALRCEIMGDIENLHADDINEFYNSKEGEKTNGE